MQRDGLLSNEPLLARISSQEGLFYIRKFLCLVSAKEATRGQIKYPVFFCGNSVDLGGAKCLDVGQKGKKVLESGGKMSNEIEMSGGFFTGEYLHSLDSKRRLTIPSEWRDVVGEPQQLYVLPGVESKCLSMYRVPDFMRKLSRLQEHSIADPKARQMARILGARSSFLGWDSVGRIRIKDDLLEYANLDRKVVLVGALDRIELWNPEQWDALDKGGGETGLEDAVRYVNF